MSAKEEFNPVLRAVTAIRHLAIGLKTNWTDLKEIGKKIDDTTSLLTAKIEEFGNQSTQLKLESELGRLQENKKELKTILDSAIQSINKREAISLSSNWENSKAYSQAIRTNIEIIHNLGTDCLPENETERWKELHGQVLNQMNDIKNISEACGLQLLMIEKYKPEEVDELSNEILKHVPINYSIEEVDTYERDYLKAYEEIKNEASKKKNLWDKFLDVLAGGVQQTPAQRVMMQRWVEGERNDLR